MRGPARLGSRGSFCAALAALALPAAAHNPEPVVDCGDPLPLSFTESAHTENCALGPGETHVFGYTGDAGDRVRILLSNQGVSGIDFDFSHVDPSLSVTGPGATPVGSDACDGGTAPGAATPCAAVVEIESLPASGSYEIRVSDAGMDEAGGYTLQLERLPERSPDDPPVVDDELDFDTIFPATDVDHVQLEVASAPASLEVALESVKLRGSNDPLIDARIELFDPQGARIEDVWCQTEGSTPVVSACSAGLDAVCVARIDRDLDESGTYALAFSDVDSARIGNYCWSVRLPEPPRPAGVLAALATAAWLARRRRDR